MWRWPVIVTVLCTVCGLIPLAVEGGELWYPLTAVHIVGLLCATTLTLIVLPVVYLLCAEKLKWIKKAVAGEDLARVGRRIQGIHAV